MSGMEMAMPALEGWTLTDGLLVYAMWAVMMAAMMLPAATPVILLFSRMSASRAASRGLVLPFVAGYLTVWWAFSVIATLAQWGLHSAAALSPEMRAASPIVGGLILIAAGIYQWLPLKHECLGHCRSPLGFLMTSWREGPGGAFRMGTTHGMFCVGCCWMIMALLFVVGVMNLVWVAALAALVLLEKILPRGPAIARAAGVVMAIAGIALSVSQ